MAKFIRHSEWITNISYTHDFQWEGEARGSGFMFDVDEHGNVLNMPEPAMENYRKCITNTHHKPVIDMGIQRHESEYREPAVIECNHCRQHVELSNSMTNQCDCGTFYNGSGQQLAPPSQWGWETGERFDDNGNQIGFVED